MQLEIEKLVYGGDGLARLPADEHGRGKTAFVPFVFRANRSKPLSSKVVLALFALS